MNLWIRSSNRKVYIKQGSNKQYIVRPMYGDMFLMSEWLLFNNVNSAIFQLYNGESKLIFNDNEVRFVLDQHP